MGIVIHLHTITNYIFKKTFCQEVIFNFLNWTFCFFYYILFMISILNILWGIHMKIAIIDDDQNDREYLITYIKNYGQNHPFPFSIDTFSSGELFLKNSMYNEYSIIFVDIYGRN